MSFVALYAPNTASPDFFVQIETTLSERHEHKIIIGDFNLVLDIGLDRENTYNNNYKAQLEVENIMDRFCMKDTWREQNEGRREFSWKKKVHGQ